VRALDDLQRPEAQRKQPKEADRCQSDDPDAEKKAGAAVEVSGRDRDRAYAETPRDANAAAAARGVGDEVAQR
jgi:hypothetical protein